MLTDTVTDGATSKVSSYTYIGNTASVRLEVKYPGGTYIPVTGSQVFDGLNTLVTGTTIDENPAQPAAPTMRSAVEYVDGGVRSEVHGSGSGFARAAGIGALEDSTSRTIIGELPMAEAILGLAVALNGIDRGNGVGNGDLSYRRRRFRIVRYCRRHD